MPDLTEQQVGPDEYVLSCRLEVKYLNEKYGPVSYTHLAQNFGLSDLHQLRGRVGRSNQKAYCYLLSPPDELLSSDARRRLRAIEEFSDLEMCIRDSCRTSPRRSAKL